MTDDRKNNKKPIKNDLEEKDEDNKQDKNFVSNSREYIIPSDIINELSEKYDNYKKYYLKPHFKKNPESICEKNFEEIFNAMQEKTLDVIHEIIVQYEANSIKNYIIFYTKLMILKIKNDITLKNFSSFVNCNQISYQEKVFYKNKIQCLTEIQEPILKIIEDCFNNIQQTDHVTESIFFRNIIGLIKNKNENQILQKIKKYFQVCNKNLEDIMKEFKKYFSYSNGYLWNIMISKYEEAMTKYNHLDDWISINLGDDQKIKKIKESFYDLIIKNEELALLHDDNNFVEKLYNKYIKKDYSANLEDISFEDFKKVFEKYKGSISPVKDILSTDHQAFEDTYNSIVNYTYNIVI